MDTEADMLGGYIVRGISMVLGEAVRKMTAKLEQNSAVFNRKM